MKKIDITARTLSGLVGLVTCYVISIYFFWTSQITFGNFYIDPAHSKVTRLIYYIGIKQYFELIGVVLAFLSIHASWAYRYSAGNIVSNIYSYIKFNFFNKNESYKKPFEREIYDEDKSSKSSKDIIIKKSDQ